MHEGNLNLFVHYMNNDEIKKVFRKITKLQTQGDSLMSAISDFVAKQKEYMDKLNSAMDAIKGDISGLQDKIVKLQESQGKLSDEDQAALDDLSTHGQSIVDKANELDNLNAPEMPEQPEEPQNPGEGEVEEPAQGEEGEVEAGQEENKLNK